MTSNLPLIFLAFLGGAVLPIQIGFNGGLRQALGHPMQATFVSFVGGALAALVACFLLRTPVPTADKLAQPAWWMWLAGCFGAFYIWTMIVATPRIGAALAFSLAVAGQMIVAALLDHVGALGFPKEAISPLRLLGIGLLIAGVLVISYSKQV